MNRLIKNLLNVVVVLLAVSFCVPVFAQEQRGVQVQLSSPVMVPGGVLEPGTYLFKEFDPMGHPNTIEIVNVERTEIVGYFSAVPTQRQDARQSVVGLSSPNQIGLRTVTEIYAAGERDGFEFLYSPKDLARAVQLARAEGAGSSVVAGK